MAQVRVTKAHAYGNDFLFVPRNHAQGEVPALARMLCDRHQGIGGDGLIVYEERPHGATMRLLNADGSPSELSGNGLRCLAALIAREQRLGRGAIVQVSTDAGEKTLELLERDGQRYTFRAALGHPENVRQEQIPVLGETINASVLRMGNPQCVILGELPRADRFNRLGPALATHAFFPAGTNVEFAHIETPTRLRILIWERGVGPTLASGTGASASAVAAAAHGGAARDVEVISPGGTQRVEWRGDGVYLTGWAELVFHGEWIREV
jgi:diaminopimelate epimerase